MERVVIESKRELLVETLNKQVAEYKKKTGVDLAGKSVKEIYSKATTEYNKLYEEINAEYETQKKVVDCIECGDINEAKRLLGMDVEESSDTEAEVETESAGETIDELEVGDDFELEVDEDDVVSEEENTIEDEVFEDKEDEEDEVVEVDDGFADLEIEEIDLDDLGAEEEVEEEPKKVKKTKKGMDNPFDKTDDIFDFVEKADKKAGAKKVEEKKAEEKAKAAKAEPKKVEDGVEGLADFFEDDDEILDFADGIDGLSLDFN